MIQLFTTAIDDRTTPQDMDRTIRNLRGAVRELQLMPTVRVIKDVSLVDATPTLVPHRMGRPVFVSCSPVRGASTSGRIEEVRDGSYDRSLYLMLTANGFGATVTVDLLVVPV